jgi:hypothetical protein
MILEDFYIKVTVESAKNIKESKGPGETAIKN